LHNAPRRIAQPEVTNLSGGYYRIGFLLVLLATLEFVAAPLISTAVLVGSTNALGVEFTQEYVLLAIFSALLCYTLVRQEGNERGIFVSGWTIATRAGLAWLAVVGILLLIGYATKVSEIYSRRALFLWFIATPPLLMAAPVLLRQGFRRIAVLSGNTRSVVIAGVNRVSHELARSITTRPELGLDHKGFFDDRGNYRASEIGTMPLLGTLADLPSFAKLRRIDVIFIALPYHLERTKALIGNLRDTTASVYLIPDISFIDLIQARADDISGVPIIALCESPLHGWSGFKKRATDVVLASAMLLAALPLMLLIVLALMLTSHRSVIFRQTRYGLDGAEITVYKFRTLTVDEDGPSVRQVTRDDPRVTRVGRFLRHYSLDELPQLINVIQGRMSLVGPRPHAVAHNEEYRKLIDGYMVRHKVTPGMTGLAQVNGCRGETTSIEDMRRRIDYDLDYLRHWSLMLDLKILFRTLAIMFREKAQ
jgi:putative colanic acid biosynthesis UDP-glucose lipid carrier transferase